MDKFLPLAPWLVAFVLPLLLSHVAAGVAWVLVRSEAGGGVRMVATWLSVMGMTARGQWVSEPAPGIVPWILRFPDRLLGCAGCTSWWAGFALGGFLEVIAVRAIHGGVLISVLPVLLAAALTAFGAAREGSAHDATWLAMVLTAESARQGVQHPPGSLEDLPEPAEVVAAAMAGAAAVVSGTAQAPGGDAASVPSVPAQAGATALHYTAPVPQVPSDVASP